MPLDTTAESGRPRRGEEEDMRRAMYTLYARRKNEHRKIGMEDRKTK
jgi:hypothetical protein